MPGIPPILFDMPPPDRTEARGKVYPPRPQTPPPLQLSRPRLVEFPAAVGEPRDVEPIVAADVATDEHQIDAALLAEFDERVPVFQASRFETGPRMEHMIHPDG